MAMTPEQEKALLSVCQLAACVRGPHLRQEEGKPDRLLSTADIINEALEAFGSTIRLQMKTPEKPRRKRAGSR